MKNLLWTVLFINLLSLGLGLGYATLRPEKIRNLLTGNIVPPGSVIEVAGATPGRPSAPPRPRSQPSPSPSPEAGGSDKPAPSAADLGPRRPPPRTTRPAKTAADGAAAPADGKRPPAASSSLKTSPIPKIRAKYLGPQTDDLVSEPPAPEYYPFRVDRRSFTPEGEVHVELSIQNASGYYWRVAQIVFKSPGHPRGEVFEVEEWGIDQIVGIDYKFPKAELSSRLGKLRVARVTGERRETAMASLVAEARSELVKEMGSKDAAIEEIKRADAGLPAGTTAAEGDAPAARVRIDPALSIAAEPFWKMPEDTPEQVEVAGLLREAHSEAREVEARLQAFADVLNEHGYLDGMAKGGKERIAEINAAVTKFNLTGSKVYVAASRSKDAAVKDSTKTVDKLADSILNLQGSVERQVKLFDPQFQINL